tara:strand:+ start:5859 stop:6617 length:759 start_codon:yes stop_codon:yes gene_type:complete
MDKLRISTITALSKFDTNIDLKLLFDNVGIDDTIKFAQWGLENCKGFNNKQKIRSRTSQKKKNVFYNQVTFHYYLKKIINVKIFNNGKIHMTGLKNIESGKKVIDGLKNIIKKMNKNTTDDIIDNKDFNALEYKILLINSDFMIDYKIDRNMLHRHIINMDMFSSYEPLIYPGVNIKYFYNRDYTDGICKCSCNCNGKGNSLGNGNCKRITIAVFMSGSIIITGANNTDQLLEAYNFINDLMIQNKQKFILK